MKLTTLNSVSDLQQYSARLLDRVHHHAEKMLPLVVNLLGVVIAYHDAKKPIRIYSNAVWVYFHGRRYFFSSTRGHNSVTIKRDGMQGPVLADIPLTASAADVEQIIRNLAKLAKKAA